MFLKSELHCCFWATGPNLITAVFHQVEIERSTVFIYLKLSKATSWKPRQLKLWKEEFHEKFVALLKNPFSCLLFLSSFF